MKKLLIVMLAMMILGGCDPMQEFKNLKAKNQELEKRVTALELKIIQLEQVSSNNEIELDACLERASLRRDTNVKLNDTKQKKGMHTVPIILMDQIRKEYKDDCDECYRRYGRK